MAIVSIDRPVPAPERIGRIFAYLAVNEAGREGVAVAEVISNGAPGMIPLVAGDAARLQSIAPIAAQLARNTGQVLRLVEFTGRVDIRLVTGRGDA